MWTCAEQRGSRCGGLVWMAGRLHACVQVPHCCHFATQSLETPDSLLRSAWLMWLKGACKSVTCCQQLRQQQQQRGQSCKSHIPARPPVLLQIHMQVAGERCMHASHNSNEKWFYLEGRRWGRGLVEFAHVSLDGFWCVIITDMRLTASVGAGDLFFLGGAKAVCKQSVCKDS